MCVKLKYPGVYGLFTYAHGYGFWVTPETWPTYHAANKALQARR